jgi:protein TonB
MKILLTLLLLTFLITGRSFSQIAITDSLKNNINPDSVYSAVDIPAEHPNGKEARIRSIEKNVDAGIGSINGAPVGTYKVRIACIVDAGGKIIAMVPETHEGYGMEKEMMRVLKKLPTFKPAIKNGVAVKSKIVFPVVFMSRSAN